MQQRTVCVRIRGDGSCTIDAQHFADTSCRDATAQILAALAAKPTSENEKPEARVLPRTFERQRESLR